VTHEASAHHRRVGGCAVFPACRPHPHPTCSGRHGPLGAVAGGAVLVFGPMVGAAHSAAGRPHPRPRGRPLRWPRPAGRRASVVVPRTRVWPARRYAALAGRDATQWVGAPRVSARQRPRPPPQPRGARTRRCAVSCGARTPGRWLPAGRDGRLPGRHRAPPRRRQRGSRDAGRVPRWRDDSG